MDIQFARTRRSLGRLLPVALWLTALVLVSCGTEGGGPFDAVERRGADVADAESSGSGAELGTGANAAGERTLGHALGSVGKGNSADDPAALLAADQESTPEQARLAVMETIVHLSSGDHGLLTEALYEPDPAIQLVALDQLGEMAQWDAEARRSLDAFQRSEVDAGLQRRAADLLRALPPLPGAYGPSALPDEAG